MEGLRFRRASWGSGHPVLKAVSGLWGSRVSFRDNERAWVVQGFRDAAAELKMSSRGFMPSLTSGYGLYPNLLNLWSRVKFRRTEPPC